LVREQCLLALGGQWRARSHGNHGIYGISGTLFSVTYRF
jgi:hypothetical protein